MKTMMTIGLLLVFQLTFSQKRSLDSFSLELGRLITAKHHYERFREYATEKPERYTRSRDSSFNAYIAQINKIKNNSVQYIKYIEREIRKPELANELLFYNYVEQLLPFDPNEYTISKRDLYKVIKYTLLERDNKILPETLNDIPFFIKRDYQKPFKLQQKEDYFKRETEKYK